MTQALWVIIPAAGVGQRMNAGFPKQYLSLAGDTILDRTISIFIDHPMIAGIAVGLGAEDGYWPDSKWRNHKQVAVFVGGSTRSDTVRNGLQFLHEQQQIGCQSVLVHDAARPLLTATGLARIVENNHPQGAILAIPARDTVKCQTDTGKVKGTLDRNHIWLAQTPQKFPADVLYEALKKADQQALAVTDECSAMELIGWHPDLVVGESSNIKVTLPEDLLIAEALISQRH
ncbi:2-C-methyl-D-erythritol 4-phosphate cytidylyltransferase [Marinomonas pollencensis]|uniref:2-C-methyl-D-erythritol 4-phosphate cytidylyltransferase n=1 Tax=Marinomonas pollencensis TaxID=491954 RepID=A0A3E0DWH4_9GAMM|nr:2-C-methyl-D-erythritol 4-phosphate cytidylyltransferase [Marinomonas pollencensis]REG86864.1 2-C-methyl-D-erythritol 4-phosphate cytidylyltransferase [Marinomonas pollencensis]